MSLGLSMNQQGSTGQESILRFLPSVIDMRGRFAAHLSGPDQ